MKTKLLSLAALALVSFSSLGQTIMYEPFDYALSPVQPSATSASNTPNTTNQLIGKTLSGVGTWVAASSTSATIGDWITDNSTQYTGLPSPLGNSFYYKGSASKPLLPWSTSITSGKVYYSIIVKVDGWYTGGTGQMPDANGKQMFALAGNVPSPLTANPSVGYLGSFCVKGTPTKPATGFYIGLSNSHVSSTSVVGTDVVWSPTLFTFGVQHLVVVSYDIATGTSKLYLDPTVSGTEPTTPFLTLTQGATTNTVGGFYIRQDGNAATPYTQLDEIRVARTYWEALVQTKPALSVAKNDINGLKVYPNPVTDGKLFISSASNDAKQVAIYNVLGMEVLNKEVASGLLDVSSLSKGIYVLKITESGKTSTRKIVIE